MSQFYFYIDFELNVIFRFQTQLHLIFFWPIYTVKILSFIILFLYFIILLFYFIFSLFPFYLTYSTYSPFFSLLQYHLIPKTTNPYLLLPPFILFYFIFFFFKLPTSLLSSPPFHTLPHYTSHPHDPSIFPFFSFFFSSFPLPLIPISYLTHKLIKARHYL